MKAVTVIGMGMSPSDLTRTHRQLIDDAEVLIGSRRHLVHFQETPSEKKELSGDLDELGEFIKARMDGASMVVLASGDPLFYGIGAYLRRHLPENRLRFYPNVSAVATAFARLGLPWQDARVVSLHGRQATSQLAAALLHGQPIAVYTDLRHHPAWIAARLRERGVSGWEMCVLERLGSAAERIRWFALDAAAGEDFADPNLVILKRVDGPPSQGLFLGMPDSAFQHSGGLITKSEVRGVVLAKLQLRPGLTLWDLGAGSGAVGLEASLLLGGGRIIAVERRSERVAQIRENARRFQVYTLEAVQADLPDGMDRLPHPDRIFIGGGGADLVHIIRAAIARLPKEGVMVVNTILTANLEAAIEAMQQADLETETVMVQIHRSVAMPWSQRFEALNPIWVITGKMKVR